MSKWNLQFNETTCYFSNRAEQKEADQVAKQFAKGYDTIYVSFDVTGRTCHQILSHQLVDLLKKMYGPMIDSEIGYNYECTLKWRRHHKIKMAYEMQYGNGCSGCNGEGCNGNGCERASRNNTGLDKVTMSTIWEPVAPGCFEHVPHYYVNGKDIESNPKVRDEGDYIKCFQDCKSCDKRRRGECDIRVDSADSTSIDKIDKAIEFKWAVQEFGDKVEQICAIVNSDPRLRGEAFEVLGILEEELKRRGLMKK
ncbi:MAG: hypothetical protein ACOX8G_10920 [Eubacterium sp.]|jgi:hypothetical protein